MTYDSKNKLRQVTLAEFDAAMAFLQAQMAVLMNVTPQDLGETRAAYIDRVRCILLNSGMELPGVVADMRRDGRDYLLALLANPDANKRNVALLRQQLADCERGALSASDGYSRLSRALNPVNHANIERAVFNEHAKSGGTKLNIQ